MPQAIGWSQIEISLAVILACAPMSSKLLLHPLNTEKLFARMRDSEMGKKGTRNLVIETGVEKGSMGTGTVRDLNVHQVLPGGKEVIVGRSITPREIYSPDYQRLRVVRAEVDGHTVWEVRPASPNPPV